MKKDTRNKDAFYALVWSKVYRYDRYTSKRILPELSGIVALMTRVNDKEEYLMFYACWRDGMRVAIKKLMDPLVDKHKDIRAQLDPENLYYKYTAVETNIKDLQDIMYWLIKTYKPLLNDAASFKDSERYMNISVTERVLREGEITERFFRPA